LPVQLSKKTFLAGYAFLIERYGLSALPNWHTSCVSLTGTLRSTIRDGQVESVYPPSYWPGEGTGDHLEFALKYDGVNLGCCRPCSTWPRSMR
jgi:hypothetical protein